MSLQYGLTTPILEKAELCSPIIDDTHGQVLSLQKLWPEIDHVLTALQLSIKWMSW